MSKTKYTTEVRYFVFELRDGLMKEPKEWHYTSETTVFEPYGYNTQDRAVEAISKTGGCAEYIVLPKVIKSIDWSE